MEGWQQRRLGSMGTILKKKKKQRRRKKKWEKGKKRLDTNRPSHGRTWGVQMLSRRLSDWQF
jgi:hypothetical protein